MEEICGWKVKMLEEMDNDCEKREHLELIMHASQVMDIFEGR